jgi:hypothetical protein
MYYFCPTEKRELVGSAEELLDKRGTLRNAFIKDGGYRKISHELIKI